jgi:hypothetical protein
MWFFIIRGENIFLSIKKIEVINIISSSIYKDALIFPKDRKEFKKTDDYIIIPNYFYRIIGIEHSSESEYYNELYKMDINFKNLECNYQKFEKGFNTYINNELLNKINKIWTEISADKNLRAMYLGPNLFGAKLIKHTNNRSKDELIKNTLTFCIDIFIKYNKNNNSTIIKNFCTKMIFWFNQYGYKGILDLDENFHNPKIIYYGNIKRDEAFFLVFLAKLGFDIIYINSENDKIFDLVDKLYICGVKFEFKQKTLLKEFPKEEKLETIETAASIAENRIDNFENDSTGLIIKPWQFNNYNVKAKHLRTGLEELFSIWKLNAKDRNGFEIEKNKIIVPNIFVKINGTESDLENYWQKIMNLLKLKEDYFIFVDKFPISHKNNVNIEMRGLININGFLNVEKIKKSSNYNLKFLKTSMQNNILEKANELIEKKYLLYVNDYNFKMKIINTILNLDKKVLRLLQIFDYPFLVPKVIIYDNSEKILSEEDCITLALLNALGLDIAIITPSGYNNIENYINSDLISIQNLENLKFDLNYPKDVKKILGHKKTSVFGNIFNWIKKNNQTLQK